MRRAELEEAQLATLVERADAVGVTLRLLTDLDGEATFVVDGARCTTLAEALERLDFVEAARSQ